MMMDGNRNGSGREKEGIGVRFHEKWEKRRGRLFLSGTLDLTNLTVLGREHLVEYN